MICSRSVIFTLCILFLSGFAFGQRRDQQKSKAPADSGTTASESTKPINSGPPSWMKDEDMQRLAGVPLFFCFDCEERKELKLTAIQTVKIADTATRLRNKFETWQTGWQTGKITPTKEEYVAFMKGIEADIKAVITENQWKEAEALLEIALRNAQERADRIRCASNLRMIGQGRHLYANDNKVRPPDLGTIMLGTDVSPETFLCPGGKTKLPANFATMDAKEKARWINANSDYVYVTAGNQPQLLKKGIMAYEKSGHHGDGIVVKDPGVNVLFEEGYVKFFTDKQAEKLLGNE